MTPASHSPHGVATTTHHPWPRGPASTAPRAHDLADNPAPPRGYFEVFTALRIASMSDPCVASFDVGTLATSDAWAAGFAAAGRAAAATARGGATAAGFASAAVAGRDAAAADTVVGAGDG